ncbi:glycosyltransferase [Arthrobacter sp. MYb222]|uniref:glycosyltransferase n=1 Tax=Arthrobacter sp. MYb222 TaxID=1848599 RepID=UPI000CFDD9CC|nr:glycosyltransferase [Arthrobacter sp. MYb222]PQZ86554.1 hypothetical protein CQ016_10975 [Arthrobacter sp. MYb222]
MTSKHFRVAGICLSVLALAIVVAIAYAWILSLTWLFVCSLLAIFMLLLASIYIFIKYSEKISDNFSTLTTKVRNLEDRDRRNAKALSDIYTKENSAHSKIEDFKQNLNVLQENLSSSADYVANINNQVRQNNKRTNLELGVIKAEIATSNERMIANWNDTNDKISEEISALSNLQQHHHKEVARELADINEVIAGNLTEIRQEIAKEIEQLNNSVVSSLRNSFENSLLLGQDPASILDIGQARILASYYLENEQIVSLVPLLKSFQIHKRFTLTQLRFVYRGLRAAGYWTLAATVQKSVARKSKRDKDLYVAEKIDHEIHAYSNETTPVISDGNNDEIFDPQGPIIHMVGKVLPVTQTGYTLRTHYTAKAQISRGLPVVIVGQPGIYDREVNETEHHEHDGIDYYWLAGKPRAGALLDEWIKNAALELESLVRQIKPSIIHAQSDFINALIAQAVARPHGIPTVYESRGFWEESWLSRTINSQEWGTRATGIFEKYGLPEAYTLRKNAETRVREQADHIFTLAQVMKDHILELSPRNIANENVTLVPNSVNADLFPVQSSDDELRQLLGIDIEDVVVGYISSIVEYEGIDVLIDAFEMTVRKTTKPVSLLIVGDGDYLQKLKNHAAKIGLKNILFTGRVPHDDILKYYGLIDIFVVPRKPAPVSNLVTPLKPFEAFSTGRCVVMSDVSALKEIADQSQAVELFTAGDSYSLSEKILGLIEDPIRRMALSNKGASWVRNYRAWEHNVVSYFEVYKKLGYEGPSSLVLEAEMRLRGRNINPGDVIDQIASADQPPLASWFSLNVRRQSAREILDTGWIYAEFDPVRVFDKPDWTACSSAHRSWGFKLHSFEFLDPLLQEYSITAERQWLDAALEISLDWISTFINISPPIDPMVWYDMALALRAPRLLALLSFVSKQEDLRTKAGILLDALLVHVEELSFERAFNSSNNHGFYTAASQLHLFHFGPKISCLEVCGESGSARMKIMAERQFAADGVHLEHSPGYHQMLLESFQGAIRDGLIQDLETKQRIRNAAHVLGWMIQPDGCLVQFGDTKAAQMKTKNASSLDPVTEFILSDGKRGVKPSAELAVFNEGGYAFVRYPAPKNSHELANASYLAFSAAFHSRAHKHADDLNFVWYDRGTEILVDSGRYGYGDLLPADSPLRSQGFYYGSVERQYVEGTTAHNTVMMNGMDQQRRGRKPYGSSTFEAVQKGSKFDISAKVNHEAYLHRRRLVFRPGTDLKVVDSFYSHEDRENEATVWFNLDGGFELVESPDGLVFERTVNGELLKLSIQGSGELVSPVRGQKEPMRGWRSRLDRSLEATWSFGYKHVFDKRSSVITTFELDKTS